VTAWPESIQERAAKATGAAVRAVLRAGGWLTGEGAQERLWGFRRIHRRLLQDRKRKRALRTKQQEFADLSADEGEDASAVTQPDPNPNPDYTSEEPGHAQRGGAGGEIRRAKEDRRPVPYVSPDDIRRLEAATSDPAYQAFVRVLADTGLRSGEARRLEWRDVSLARRTVLVRRSKTHDPREVPLTTAAVDALMALRGLRGTPSQRAPLWQDLRDMSAGGVSARFRRLARRAGLEDLHAHSLRHGFCSRMAQAGVALPTVGIMTGHRSVATTQRYAGHVPDDATEAAIRRLELAKKSASRTAGGDRAGDQERVQRATA